MLTITLRINGRVIGEARARNLSDLASTSDYVVGFTEFASPSTGQPFTEGTFKITGHSRNQSAWALVREIAARIAPKG
jgi:hypothetical protein